MARGRKAKTQEQKEAEAARLADDALLRLPREPERRKELFAELDDKKDAAREASNAVGEQKKRMAKVYGLDPVAIQCFNAIRKLSSGRRECAIRQLRFLIDDFGLDDQLDMFLSESEPAGMDPDDGPAFDNSTAAERLGGEPEEEDEPEAPPPAAKPSAGIPLEEAERRFKEASAAAFEHRSVN
jgi:hypothetical protein